MDPIIIVYIFLNIFKYIYQENDKLSIKLFDKFMQNY